ncbi:hypothetical protein AGMMS49546_05870 [Spirochaetia bacterium]|nr:hypothetical protein AGMMS49546_05870 [Spirochaetia bacterium]
MLNLIEASMKMIIEKEDPLKNKIVLADTGYFSRSKAEIDCFLEMGENLWSDR